MSKIFSAANRLYSNSYRKRPFITLSFTNGFLCSISDTLAQSMSLYGSSPKKERDDSVKTVLEKEVEKQIEKQIETKPSLKHKEGEITGHNSFNFTQLGRFALYGTMIAPIIHTWYSFLDRKFPLHAEPTGTRPFTTAGFSPSTKNNNIDSNSNVNTRSNGSLIKLRGVNLQFMNTIVRRVAVDQIMFAPIGVGSFFVIIGALEGRNIHEIKEKIDEVFFDSILYRIENSLQRIRSPLYLSVLFFICHYCDLTRHINLH